MLRLDVVKWLLFSGISGCKFGGRIGSIVKIIYFGLLLDCWNDFSNLRCLVIFLCLVLELIEGNFLCMVVILVLMLRIVSKLKIVLVFILVLNLLLCFFRELRYFFLLRSCLCFKVVIFGLVIMYDLK